MIIGIAKSIAGVKIRLTQERWHHIITSHLEIDPKEYKIVLDVVENPDVILRGDSGEPLAAKKQSRKRVWNVVIYKEINKEDAFIVTGYLTSDNNWLFKREIIWSKD